MPYSTLCSHRHALNFEESIQTANTCSKQMKRKFLDENEVSDDIDNEVERNSEIITDDSELDTKPLSHAAQRKAKKQKRTPKKTSVATISSKETTSVRDKIEAPVQRRQNSIWVGNLSFKTTSAALKEFFRESGEVTRIHLPTKLPTTQNLGFAYVDFATADAKATAIEMSEKNLDGRKLLIKDGSDFTRKDTQKDEENSKGLMIDKSLGYVSKKANKILSSQKQPPGPALFLGNLGFETTDKQIREFIEIIMSRPTVKAESHEDKKDDSDTKSDIGIRKIRLGEFEDSGKCKGFAFVDFTSTNYATNALLKLSGRTLDKRKLVVEYASADAIRRGGGRPSIKNVQQDTGNAKDAQALRHNKVPADAKAKPTNRERREDFVATTFEEVRSIPQRNNNTSSEKQKTYVQRRLKPGAALASAPRETAGIVASQGTHLTFD